MPEWLVGERSAWFWSMLQFFGVVGSLGFIYFQLRAQVTGNMMQSLHAMAEKWDSDHMVAFRQAACTNYGRDDLDICGVDGEVLAFFEDIGLYCRKKVFTIDVVWEHYSYYIEHYWAMYHSHITNLRTKIGDRSWFANFEFVHQRLAEYGHLEYGVRVDKTAEVIARFAASELRTCAIHRDMSRAGRISRVPNTQLSTDLPGPHPTEATSARSS